MALGTLTRTDHVEAGGPVFHDRVSIVGDTSYPTGGSTGLLAKLRAVTKDHRAIVSAKGEAENGANYAEYIPATDKLFVRVAATGVEVANGTDLSGVTFVLAVTSK